MESFTVCNQLQWGHRFTSVETNFIEEEIKEGKKLQWGHRFTSVETVIKSISYCKIIWLQWGHRFTSVETILFSHINPESLYSFNGATDLHRWKPTQVVPGDINMLLLQWGHRFTSVETWRPVPESGRGQGFNGATDLHRWKQIIHLILYLDS